MRIANVIILATFACLTITTTCKMASTQLTTDARVMNEANLSSMTIIGDEEDKNAYFLKAGKHTCTIKSKDSQLQFAIDGTPFLSANHGSMHTSKGTVLNKGVAFRNNIEVNTKRQWALAFRMDHSDFDPAILYTCGIYKMLGGYKKTSRDEMTKTFKLPAHKMIKIEGHFHFIDNWKGETAYIKVYPI